MIRQFGTFPVLKGMSMDVSTKRSVLFNHGQTYILICGDTLISTELVHWCTVAIVSVSILKL